MNTTGAQIQTEIDQLKAQAQVAAADAKLGILRKVDELQEQLKKAQEKMD